MRYQHADLVKTQQFLEDFGMTLAYTEDEGKILYFAGQGKDPFVYVAMKVSKTQGSVSTV